MRSSRGSLIVLAFAALLGLTALLAPVSAASAASLSGTMRDADGDPVAGVTLRAENRSALEPTVVAETAADGSYSFSLVPGNYTVSTYVGKPLPGLPPAWALQTAQFAVAADATRDLTLPPTATVTVEALGEGGAPIAGANVDLGELISSANLGGYTTTELRSRDLRGVTGQDGRLSLTVFDDGSFREQGSIFPPPGSGYSFTRFSSPAVDGDTTIAVNPPAAASISGTMRDAAGDPVAGVTLRARNQSALEPTVEAKTGADGSYSLTLAPGDYKVSTFVGTALPGLPTEWALDTAQFAVAGDATRDLTLPPTATVTVEALGTGGTPIAGAEVDLSELLSTADLGGYATTELRSRGLHGFTDQNGRLSLTVFDDGSFREQGSIFPPPGSGYGFTRFSSPPVHGNTTIVIRFAGAAPIVTGIQSRTGPEAGGTEVTIYGNGFAGASEVRFGSTPAASFEVVSPTSITAVAPAGTGHVDVTVTTPGGTSATSAADRFSYGPPVGLRSSPNPSHRKQKVTFRAKVKPAAAGAPLPHGTVAFVEGSTILGVAKLRRGKARFSTRSLKAGKHRVVAVYSGDARFGTSSSKAIVQVVVK